MRFRTALSALATGLLLAACDSSTSGPQPLTGIYAAQTADGRPVPATLDSAQWNDGSTFTVFRLMGASVEFLDDETARYTFSERTVTYMNADSLHGDQCYWVNLPYRMDQGRVLLVVEPALFGETGRLRVDTLPVQNNRLTQTVRASTGKRVQVEFAPAQEATPC